jgi:hypothetical protein
MIPVYTVFWLENGEPRLKQFEEQGLSEMLNFQNELRKSEANAFITSAIENPNNVGRLGASQPADDYNWMKRRGPDHDKRKRAKLGQIIDS